ncbi:MAG: putative methyltransferase YcgJ [Candidatus Heimdallarchaeota archaeon LC_2]|nr:MAG: putative methyltransferase YcgJ [Candidatus Heimdallarchaeota archaeon LC_2]
MVRRIINWIVKSKKKTKETSGSSIVEFDIATVAGGGASTNLPQFASRLYYETKQIRDTLNGRKFEKSLEIGAGYARLSPLITEFSDEHHAIEPSAELYAISKNLYSNIKFINTTADSLPYADNSFDFILTWTVLQHIPTELFEKSIQEINRVAKANATLLICEYTKETPSKSTFGHSIEEYNNLFVGFELLKADERITELDYFTGHVMLFEGIKQENGNN